MDTATGQENINTEARGRRGLLGRGWRKSTWALIAWGIIITVLGIIALGSGHDATSQCQSVGGALGSYCQESVNSQISAKLDHVFKIGILGLIPLSLVWFMSRPQD